MSWVADVWTTRRHRPGPNVLPRRASFRIEVPSVEGPKVLEAALARGRSLGRQVTGLQGSGAVLMRVVDLRDMAQRPEAGSRPACSGPRERTESGRTPGPRTAGRTGTRFAAAPDLHALEDVLRATRKESAASWSPTSACSAR